MAAKLSSRSLVIVESPAKARTISRYLGNGTTVEASVGHIRDLPQGTKDLPEQYKGKEWARLGVNLEKDFEPIYVIPAEKKKQVARLRKAVQGADELFLATDEDREGEAISWHLCQVLNPQIPVRRLVFHEITQEAIEQAVRHPRDIDEGLVRAQEARRILDRLFGYDVSMLLWKKVRTGLSAGRVQSVAVRLIVERERERIAFVSAAYWDAVARLRAGETPEAGPRDFEATLVSVDGRNIPSGNDFDSSTGRLKRPDLLLLNRDEAQKLVERLRRGEFRVRSVESRPDVSRPAPPFTTSTLQQEANRKLNFTARRTMQVAQSLYENGHITYMRTDSTNLAQVAVDAARQLVRTQYGDDYLPPKPRVYASKVKNAQEAHEAIRPAGHPFELPEALKRQLSADEFKLFELIWKRTIACQMADARARRTTVEIECEGAVFQASGKTIEFPGYLRAYVEGSDDPDAELADQEKLLPPLDEGDRVECREVDAKEHVTQPPRRYSEAALTRALESRGIGRPSTYAAIIDTILARDYVFKKGGALVPTWTAFSVTKLLEEHFSSFVDYRFTAEMEDQLDAISRGEAQHKEYLKRFYFGNGQPGLKAHLENKVRDIDARETSRFFVGQPEQGEPVHVRVGRYGPFVEQDDRRASIPDKMPPDEMTLPAALELLDRAARADEPLGVDPETGRDVYLKEGRFGPYVQLAPKEEKEKPKSASLLKGMDPGDVNLDVALKLLSLPRELGEDPKTHEKVYACNGRYGPYVKCGSETRSLPDDVTPLDVSLDKALELLAQPKTRGRQRRATKEPLKTFDPSPVTGEPIKLLDGRYGLYVTDGETNASIPRGTAPEDVDFNSAVTLLQERAAKGGTKKKKTSARKSAKKKSAKSSAKKKTAGSKKSSKKKAPARKKKKPDEPSGQ